MFDDAFAPDKMAMFDLMGSSDGTNAADDGTVRPTCPAVTLNEIRNLAYSKWVAAGRPNGDSQRFWLEAEQELLRERNQP
jgi:hypothetical protein